VRCSHCSEVIKPVVAFDGDGTLGDFHRHFLRFLGQYLGVDLMPVGAHYDGQERFREWVCREFHISLATWKQIKLAYRQGGMKRTMPCYRYSAPLINFCRSQGAEVWLTTSRPAYRLDNIDPDTQEWCVRNELRFDYTIFDDDKYNVLAERVDVERVVAILDDLPEMYDAAGERFGWDVPILARSQWNSGIKRERVVRVDDYNEACRLIGHSLFNWKKQYGETQPV
jgi:hypothetical protein